MNANWVAILLGAFVNVVVISFGYGRLSTRVDDIKEVHAKWEVVCNDRFDRIQLDIREIRSLFLKANGGQK
jgi:hypothetical protein